jgi:hypothetical protein
MTPRLLAEIPSVWNHLARRFIEPPVYRLVAPNLPHPLANRWRLELVQDGVRHIVESHEPVLDAAPIWDKIRVGSWVQCRLYQLNRATNWCYQVRPLGVRVPGTEIGLIAKAPDWEERDEAPLDYAASVRANLAWFDSHENNPNAYYREPGMPAWWWHAAESECPAQVRYQNGSFPALACQAIRAFLLAGKVCPDRADHCRRLAVAIGDWLLKNHTPMTGAAPGMPYTAMSEGKFDYSADGAAINLTRGAHPGSLMLLLHQETGEQKYLDYAVHIAGVLERFIRADGSLPYRIDPATGAVVEEYTCGSSLVGLFLRALDDVAPDDCWRSGARRILHWLCENPVRDAHWKACFEDVGENKPYVNLSSMDALWTVRLLLQHLSDDPQHLARARMVLRWVEDQFVSFGDEASLGIQSYYPCVREQWYCDYPMEGHASNYANTCWEMFRHTQEDTFRHKTVATLNAIVRSQRADGAYSTWGHDRVNGIDGLGSGLNWFNANHCAMAELSAFLLRGAGQRTSPH